MSGFKCAKCGKASGKYLHCKKCHDEMTTVVETEGSTEEEEL